MKIRFVLFLALIVLLSPDFSCQSQNPAQPQKRIALVIGNGTYLFSILANPENDAKAMKTALQSAGFKVMEYENLNQGQMKKAIDDFGDKLKGNDVGLFYYAGHGIQSKGYNYLIPVDADLKSEEEVEYDCVQADRVLAKMEASGTKVNIIILDACRNNPFERSWTRSATGKGLAFMNAPRGSLIAYATSPGSTASDGSGKNGLYTSAILESIKIPDITILEMFQNVRNIVSQKSYNQQTPWESTSLTGNFYFNADNSRETARSGKRERTQETPSNNPASDQGKTEENPLKETRNPVEKDYITDSRDGQQYKTVKIGSQVWMAENLRTTSLNDGQTIPMVTDNAAWSASTSPAFCWYKNDEVSYKPVYGALYNWYAVNTGRLCPEGWHVPTDAEWTALITYLGGESVAGGKLKETGRIHWISPNEGATNESGFTALPGGSRLGTGSFYFMVFSGLWWSATDSYSSLAWLRSMHYDQSSVRRSTYGKRSGFSVRCIKDK
ncbi:MAG: FISUMP domain-containing protein [Bacteroidales bacterium]|jgi:uncharacterized protein (TIGR02145 family)